MTTHVTRQDSDVLVCSTNERQVARYYLDILNDAEANHDGDIRLHSATADGYFTFHILRKHVCPCINCVGDVSEVCPERAKHNCKTKRHFSCETDHIEDTMAQENEQYKMHNNT